ncbi:MAG: minor capsid protein [Oenococcus sp.]|uniref:minor capsid protein n=1 Tax=Oenococcus sp. TaxID=1979414 RepID=UPI0039E78B94
MSDRDKLTYWELRAVRNEQRAHDQANDKVQRIARAYTRSQAYLTDEVNKIYKRYFGNGQFTADQVNDILNTTVSPSELVTLSALAQNISDVQSKKQVIDYLSALAAKGRITQLEELQAKAYIAAKRAGAVEIRESTNLYTQVIQDAWNQANAESIIGKVTQDVHLYEKGYTPELNKADKTIKIVNPETGKTITTVKAIPDKEIQSFKQLSSDYVNQTLKKHLYNENYSQRIWHNTDKLADRLDELFTAQAMSGMTEHDMAHAIEKEFNTSIFNANRLVKTEANYFHNQTKLDGWKQRGVKEYQLVAVLDNRTSQICRNIDGRVFKVSEAIVGKTLPPMHPHCRTTAIIYFKNSPYVGTRTANNPNTKTTFQLKQDKTYHDWEQIINQSK